MVTKLHKILQILVAALGTGLVLYYNKLIAAFPVGDDSPASNAWEPIIPFYEGGYSYTGLTDPSQQIRWSVSEALKAEISDTLRRKPPNLRTRAGDTMIRYNLLPTQHHVKLTFQWVMIGGLAFTYGECADAIQNIVTYLEHNTRYDEENLKITISQAGNVKIVCTIEEMTGDDAQFDSHQALAFAGEFTPSRPLARPDIQSAIAAARKYFDGHVQRDPPPALVPREEYKSWNQGNARLQVSILFNPEEEFPQFTYSDLSDLMRAMEEWYVQKGAWGTLYGEIYRKATAAEPEFRHVGLLEIQDIVRSALPLTNDLAQETA